MSRIAKGAIPSPNIWHSPQVYELENRAVDPDGAANAAMWALRPWAGATVLDIGCGTGYHLPGLATGAASVPGVARGAASVPGVATGAAGMAEVAAGAASVPGDIMGAARVIGVEPHGDLVALARRRCARLANVTVHAGTAQDLPLPDSSVDVAVARWAYFFGPGCEPGLRELARVLRRGGTAFVIDLDAGRGPFGRWFSRTVPTYSAQRVEDFWLRQGWQRQPLDLRMVFERRADLEAVLRIEFAPRVAEEAIAETPGLELAYPNVLRWRHFPA
ncbi:class I SAM-dependent methyltransferase [Nonomuraea cavernae]|uniref:Methyltransferase type 11 n=1 Tax=Nonomuraea cavernae TaxID=2045107 RepID=A0A917YRN2_9ACTN|nr:class I SAM-dependent methyltransferase [Nonomuraea cavernae]MCA2183841.1 class I SAM-dependent methyltransferase [Nonomuraea cavernae]GGO61531.1 methyltransferase type 11 [Nonomuraea cavernae]